MGRSIALCELYAAVFEASTDSTAIMTIAEVSDINDVICKPVVQDGATRNPTMTQNE